MYHSMPPTIQRAMNDHGLPSHRTITTNGATPNHHRDPRRCYADCVGESGASDCDARDLDGLSAGMDPDAVNACAKLATCAGFSYFGVQYGADTAQHARHFSCCPQTVQSDLSQASNATLATRMVVTASQTRAPCHATVIRLRAAAERSVFRVTRTAVKLPPTLALAIP